jgi:hypothetical protein
MSDVLQRVAGEGDGVPTTTVVAGGWVAMCREDDLPAVRAALARDGHPDVPVIASPIVPAGGVLINTALLDDSMRAAVNAAFRSPPLSDVVRRWYWRDAPSADFLGGTC